MLKARESKAFIPYGNLFERKPRGMGKHVRDEAVRIREGREAGLASGITLPFAFLVVASGARMPPPAGVQSWEKEGACGELREMQERVARAGRIAVVGGGAVGVQAASDIRSFYGEKEVCLVHSWERLLSGFGGAEGEFHGYVREVGGVG